MEESALNQELIASKACKTDFGIAKQIIDKSSCSILDNLICFNGHQRLTQEMKSYIQSSLKYINNLVRQSSLSINVLKRGNTLFVNFILPCYCHTLEDIDDTHSFGDNPEEEIEIEHSLYDPQDFSSVKSSLLSLSIALIELCDGVSTKMTDFLATMYSLIENQQFTLEIDVPEYLKELPLKQKVDIFITFFNCSGRSIGERKDLRGFIIEFIQEKLGIFENLCSQLGTYYEIKLWYIFISCSYAMKSISTSAALEIYKYLLRIISLNKSRSSNLQAITILSFLIRDSDFLLKLCHDPFELVKCFDLLQSVEEEKYFEFVGQMVSHKYVSVLEKYSQKLLEIVKKRIEYEHHKSSRKTNSLIISRCFQLLSSFFDNTDSLGESFLGFQATISELIGLLDNPKEIEFESDLFEFASILIKKGGSLIYLFPYIADKIKETLISDNFTFFSVQSCLRSFYMYTRKYLLKNSYKTWESLNEINIQILDLLPEWEKNYSSNDALIFLHLLTLQFQYFNQEVEDPIIRNVFQKMYFIAEKFSLKDDLFTNANHLTIFSSIGISLLNALHYYSDCFGYYFVENDFINKLLPTILKSFFFSYDTLSMAQIKILKVGLITILRASQSFSLNADFVISLVVLICDILKPEIDITIDDITRAENPILKKKDYFELKGSNISQLETLSRSQYREIRIKKNPFEQFMSFKNTKMAEEDGLITTRLYSDLNLTDFPIYILDEYQYLRTTISELTTQNSQFPGLLRESLPKAYLEVLSSCLQTVTIKSCEESTLNRTLKARKIIKRKKT